MIEDDYLSELQLKGRAAPALASLDRTGRVIHIGSFSKTLSPALRLGFLVAPASLAARFAEVAACLAPAPGPSVQLATADFMRDGHYLRHLRRAKRFYAAQGDALLQQLRAHSRNVTAAGLAAVVQLPDGAPDLAIAREAASFGLAPTPLSLWYASRVSAQSGLLLGIATAPQKHLAASCDRLYAIIRSLHTCAAEALPSASRRAAAEPTQILRLGMIVPSRPLPGTRAFEGQLRELGYEEGRTCTSNFYSSLARILTAFPKCRQNLSGGVSMRSWLGTRGCAQIGNRGYPDRADHYGSDRLRSTGGCICREPCATWRQRHRCILSAGRTDRKAAELLADTIPD